MKFVEKIGNVSLHDICCRNCSVIHDILEKGGGRGRDWKVSEPCTLSRAEINI